MASGQNKWQDYETNPSIIKIIMLGNIHVGKTSFLSRYVDDRFYSPITIGNDYKEKIVLREGKKMKLHIWDTNGMTRYWEVTKSCLTTHCRFAIAAILMYDITDEESFSSLQFWVTQVKTYLKNIAQVVIVGNKCDMEDKRVVSTERGKDLSDQLGFEFFETSASDNINVREAMERLEDIIYLQCKIAKLIKNIQIPEKEKQQVLKILSEKEKEIVELKENIVCQNKTLKSSEDVINQKNLKIQDLEEKNSLLMHDLENMKKELEKFQNDMSLTEENTQKYKTKVQSLEDQLKFHQDEYASLEKQFQEEKEIRIDVEKKIFDLKETIKSHEESLLKYKSEIQVLEVKVMANNEESDVQMDLQNQPDYSLALEDSTWPRGGEFMHFPSISTEAVYIVWNIKSFLLECHRERKKLRSVDFDIAGATWNLLTSFDQKKVHSLFGINIRERSPSDPVLDCHCKISFDDYNHLTVKSINSNFKCENGLWLVEDFLSNSEVDSFLQRVYRIFCVIRVKKSNIKEACLGAEISHSSSSSAVEDHTQTQLLKKENEEFPLGSTECKVCKDFKKLLLFEEGSDVILQVQDQQFKAHRSILVARSSVFASMFQHNTKAMEVVDVDDCEPSAFPVLLEFMYCGSTEKLSAENVFSLYTSSVKFDVEDLKMKCLQFIRSNISVDTFCKTLRVSLKHLETDLLKRATEFFIRNFQTIIATTEWQTFYSENPIQGNDLFIKAAKNISQTPC